MRVELVFKSFLKFWDFRQVLKGKNLKINLRHKTITGEYTETEIKLAQQAYDAKVKRF
ncbi:MAG TPA: hypothetical protein VMR70_15975 [Flavisolibacter sp.]|nr:hypothetical protein [Flavisolibacter sp.]